MAGLKSHEIPAAHEIVKGNPAIDGPYLDDYNAAHDAARRDLTLAGQESQKERFESEELDTFATEGSELGDGGTEERVLSETPTTRTTVRTESKLEAPADDDSDDDSDSDSDSVDPNEGNENTDDGVDRPEGSTNGGEETAGNNPSFNSDIEGTDQR